MNWPILSVVTFLPLVGALFIMLVRGDAERDLPLIVADGMHRLSAAWHAEESADVACCLVDRPGR